MSPQHPAFIWLVAIGQYRRSTEGVLQNSNPKVPASLFLAVLV